jgi:copper(I)-binding protein
MTMRAAVTIVAVVIVAVLGREASAGARITVRDAWARPLPPVVESAELYMIIENTGNDPDRLTGAASPACGMMLLYERFRTAKGTMSMRETGPIVVPAGRRVELKVSGHHLMCMERKREFRAGATFPLTLRFEKAGAVTVQVTVQNR